MITHKQLLTFALITTLTPHTTHTSDFFGQIGKNGALAIVAAGASALALKTGITNGKAENRITELRKEVARVQSAHNALLGSFAASAGHTGAITFELVDGAIKQNVAALTLKDRELQRGKKLTARERFKKACQATVKTNLRKKLEVTTQQIQKAHSEIEQLRQQLVKKEEAYDQIATEWNDELKKYTTNEVSYQQEIQQLTTEIETLKTQVMQLELQVSQHCPTQELEQAKNTVATLTSELSETKNTLAVLRITSTDIISAAEKKAAAMQARAEKQTNDFIQVQGTLQAQTHQFGNIFAVVAGMAGFKKESVQGFTAQVQSASKTAGGGSIFTSQEKQLLNQLNAKEAYFKAGETLRATLHQ